MGTALTWQNGRQLATYGSGSKLVTYGYDGDGLRISKSGARNTEYIIVGGTYVGERTTINGTEYLIAYLYGDSGIIGINVNGTNYYFVKNLQGDITGIIDSAGNVVARYTYDAYGAPIDVTDGDGNAVSINNHTHIANLNPFRYRGYTYDQETGFYYLTTRYYDPYVGRFLNADAYVTTGQGFDGFNMFAYCGDNPVNRKDMLNFAVITKPKKAYKAFKHYFDYIDEYWYASWLDRWFLENPNKYKAPVRKVKP